MPLGPTELVIILVLVLIVFGAGKLPEVGSALGKGMKEFRKAKTEFTDLESSIKSDLTLEEKSKAERPKADQPKVEQPQVEQPKTTV